MALTTKIRRVMLAVGAVLAMQALPSAGVPAAGAGRGQVQQNYNQQVQTAILDIAFRQGDRRIDRNYMNNNRNLAEFTALMQNFVRDSDVEVESVDIIGGASIEGSPELNRDLSDNRAARMVEILRQYASVPQDRVHVNSRGVNWQDVLDMVNGDYRVPDHDAVVDILVNTPEAQRKAALESLNGGRAYRYMYDRIFPYVRTGRMAVTFRLVPKAPAQAAVHDTIYVVRTDTVIHIHKDDPGDARNINQNIMNVNTDRLGRRGGRSSYGYGFGYSYGKPLKRIDRVDSLLRTPILAVRSNLLAPAMNVGVEVPLGNRWSVAADWYYPWVWRNARHENCFELLGGTGELRYWFGTRHRNDEYNTKYRLLGHSLALLGGGGYWDFQRNWAGKQGEYGMVGLDYLYAMPVGRKCGLHLEFELALGAVFTQDRPYDVFQEGGLLIHRDGIYETSNWYGPVKAGINLAVPIFRKEHVTVQDGGFTASARAPKQKVKAGKPAPAQKHNASKAAPAPKPAQMQASERAAGQAPAAAGTQWESAWDAVRSGASASVNTVTVNGKKVK